MSRPIHGRCHSCGVIYRWIGRPLLREALCPGCKGYLDQTCPSLLKRPIQIIDQAPLRGEDRRRVVR